MITPLPEESALIVNIVDPLNERRKNVNLDVHWAVRQRKQAVKPFFVSICDK